MAARFISNGWGSILNFCCPFAIVYSILRKLKFGQSIRDEGPKSHQKSGTPTMGGIVIYVSMMVTSLIMAIKFNYLGAEVSLLLLVTFGYGLIGFLDDYIKVVKKKILV